MRPFASLRVTTQKRKAAAYMADGYARASRKPGIWTGTMIDLTHPGQRYIRCAGSLGWAFPASLGVKCALPDTPVLCFTGDGGFYYHLAEPETAARFGIRVERPNDLQDALKQAFAAGRPAVVEVLSDLKALASRPWGPGGQARGRSH